MPFTYVLECADGTFYTGSTWDVRARLRQHQAGDEASYTRRRRPVRLVYYEEYERVADAYAREKRIHGWTHGKKRRLIRTGPGVRIDDDTRLWEIDE